VHVRWVNLRRVLYGGWHMRGAIERVQRVVRVGRRGLRRMLHRSGMRQQHGSMRLRRDLLSQRLLHFHRAMRGVRLPVQHLVRRRWCCVHGMCVGPGLRHDDWSVRVRPNVMRERLLQLRDVPGSRRAIRLRVRTRGRDLQRVRCGAELQRGPVQVRHRLQRPTCTGDTSLANVVGHSVEQRHLR
jgi:hypothetical protein